MATKVHMEALSPTMEEGQVVKWLKAEGDAVANGEILAEIETDKATMELVARGDGVLRRIFLAEGGTTAVGEVIAIIAGEDEDIAELAEAAEAAEPGQPPSPAVEAASQPPSPATAPPSSGRAKSSPVARRLAEESGVDVASVPGSGPGGRVVKRDVEDAVARGGTGPLTRLPEVPSVEFEDFPLNQMRKTIARRLTESLGPVPHFFLTIDVDMERALEARGEINRVLEAQGERVSINDLLIRATAAALKRHPACNAAWQGDTIRRFNRVHVGVAVAVDDGLITPVVRDADLKGVARIAREVREMAARGRDKKLQPEEYTGSTFSISNLGMYGIYEFTGVINPPEGGILAVGSVEERPVVIAGEVVTRHRMRITMSCDHRVIDGATGAAFLATLKAMLEEPATILI